MKQNKQKLRLKGLLWLFRRDKNRTILRHFFCRPFSYTWRYFSSLLKKKPHREEGDFFYYGIEDLEEWKRKAKDPKTHLLIGFSYCQKPLQCPAGRFLATCLHDSAHPICTSCPLFEMIGFIPPDVVYVLIPTVNYIAEKILTLKKENPGKNILFLISSCELSLRMFSDFASAAGLCGLGVRLRGKVCPTFEAFCLAEEGKKKTQTTLADETKNSLIRLYSSLKK
jgi:hypothetical protein